MAFGVKRAELEKWKETVRSGEMAFLTHYWIDERFPDCKTVTKAGCSDIKKLISWGKQYQLDQNWIDYYADMPHFDLFGSTQLRILRAEGITDQIKRFNLNA